MAKHFRTPRGLLWFSGLSLTAIACSGGGGGGGGGAPLPPPAQSGPAAPAPAPSTPPSNPGPSTPPSNTTPLAEIAVTPSSGVAPLDVQLDASGSVDAESPTADLEARWDFEGDGVFDTPFSSALTRSFTFNNAGTFVPRVQVRDPQGLTGTADATPVVVDPASTPPPPPPPAGVTVDLLVDTNRDGAIDAADEAGEDVFDTQTGAVMVANIDDDDNDGTPDGADAPVRVFADLEDMAQLIFRAIPGLDSTTELTLTVSPAAAANRLRIFRLLGNAPTTVQSPGQASVSLPAFDLANNDETFYIEATTTRSGAWDGSATITVTARQGGAVVSQDSVALRCAPVIFPDNTLPADVLYVMQINSPFNGPNVPFFNALNANLPNGMSLVPASENTYGADRWLQDNMEVGYQLRPGAAGPINMPTYLQTERPRGGLEFYVDNAVLAPNKGRAYNGRGIHTSLNYGGNLEVAPAHNTAAGNFPFGRILVGGGAGGTLGGVPYEDHMNANQIDFLNGQRIQGPVLELSSEWLAVGHLDEIFQFVADPRASSPKPWKIILASPTLARNALVDMANRGLGGQRLFVGRSSERSISSVLNDSGLMAYNQAAQARITSVRDALLTAIGATTADVIEVPVLFESLPGGGFDFAAAYNPGIQNLVVTNNTLFVPDPEGPADGGQDIFKTITSQNLAPLGKTIIYVDIFESYHELIGEAHCGTNVERSPHATPWWTVNR